MTYRFPCPQGHLLEANEADAGRPCDCPTCGESFIIPVRPGRGASQTGEAPPVVGSLADGSSATRAVPSSEGALPPAVLDLEAGPSLLHIPCPNGHELETPVEMLDQHAKCPHCGVEFRLREQDSVEHRRKAERERAAREQAVGNAWLKWSVVTAAAVLIGLLLLFLSSL